MLPLPELRVVRRHAVDPGLDVREVLRVGPLALLVGVEEHGVLLGQRVGLDLLLCVLEATGPVVELRAHGVIGVPAVGQVGEERIGLHPKLLVVLIDLLVLLALDALGEVVLRVGPPLEVGIRRVDALDRVGDPSDEILGGGVAVVDLADEIPVVARPAAGELRVERVLDAAVPLVGRGHLRDRGLVERDQGIEAHGVRLGPSDLVLRVLDAVDGRLAVPGVRARHVHGLLERGKVRLVGGRAVAPRDRDAVNIEFSEVRPDIVRSEPTQRAAAERVEAAPEGP